MMDDDPKIAVIYFNNISGYEATNASDNYYQMIPNEKNGGQYILNCQAALWKRDSLKKLAQMFDSPWQFEVEGYTRAINIIDKIGRKSMLQCWTMFARLP